MQKTIEKGLKISQEKGERKKNCCKFATLQDSGRNSEHEQEG